MRKWGWACFVLGLLSILAGILAKRVFNLQEYLLVFHLAGGLLILAGGMMAFTDRSSKE